MSTGRTSGVRVTRPCATANRASPFSFYRRMVVNLIDLELVPNCISHIDYVSSLTHLYMGTGWGDSVTHCMSKLCTLHDILEFLRQIRMVLMDIPTRFRVLWALPMTLTKIMELITGIHSMLVDLGFMIRPDSCMFHECKFSVDFFLIY